MDYNNSVKRSIFMFFFGLTFALYIASSLTGCGYFRAMRRAAVALEAELLDPKLTARERQALEELDIFIGQRERHAWIVINARSGGASTVSRTASGFVMLTVNHWYGWTSNTYALITLYHGEVESFMLTNIGGP